MNATALRHILGATAALLVLAPPLAAQQPDGPTTLTLDQAVRAALAESPELEAARLELSAASGRAREAWSSVFPDVRLSTQYTRNVDVPVSFLPERIFNPTAPEDALVPVRFGSDNTWFGQVRMEQPIFDGAAFIGVGAASRYRALQEEVAHGVAQGVVTRTRLAYYDVLLASEAERLGGESVRRLRETLTETQAMNRAGLVSEYDVLRIEVELGNQEPNLRRAENALAAARRTLAVQLGMSADREIRVEGSLAAIDLAAPAGDPATMSGIEAPEALPTETLIEHALRRRSELRQLDLTGELRRAELRAEQSEYLPKVSLVATYQRNAQENGAPNFFAQGDPLGQDASTKQVGILFSMPLFNGFARPARVQQKRAALAQVETQERLAVEQVKNQVRTLADQAREARSRAEAQKKALAQAKRGYDIARAQFREGIGSRLELTDAEVALRQSEYNYAQAVYDYLTARARLDEAVGVVPGVDAADQVTLNDQGAVR